jgi:hypothetical protein
MSYKSVFITNCTGMPLEASILLVCKSLRKVRTREATYSHIDSTDSIHASKKSPLSETQDFMYKIYYLDNMYVRNIYRVLLLIKLINDNLFQLVKHAMSYSQD